MYGGVIMSTFKIVTLRQLPVLLPRGTCFVGYLVFVQAKAFFRFLGSLLFFGGFFPLFFFSLAQS